MTDRAELRKLDELDADPAAAIQRLIDEANELRAVQPSGASSAAYFDGKVSGLLAALAAVQSPWVSVKDRLPPEGVVVLAFDGKQTICCLHRHHEYFVTVPGTWEFYGTHWMPLPPPPKEPK